MFTADEYRTAAKVLKEVGTSDPTAVPTLEAKAENLHKRYLFARDIGHIGISASPETRGELILAKLLGDGWTPPADLF